MTSLFDVQALEPLENVCREFGVHVELFGGAVTRITQRLIGPASITCGIFDLAGPFSDLDLSHSGSSDLNAELQTAVLATIPNAECVRWDIRSTAQWAPYRKASYFNNRIPVRAMSLSSDPAVGLRDPLDGRADIRERRYRYERNPSYPGSPLFRQGKDLELFSGLIYLLALCESDLSAGEKAQQGGLSQVAEMMREACSQQTVMSLQESSYLRSRFQYLLAGLSAHAPDSEVLQRSELAYVLTFLSDNYPELYSRLQQALDGPRSPRMAVITSARIGGDLYRTPQITGLWEEGASALGWFRQTLGPNEFLGDNEDLILGSPPIPINAGRAPSNAPPGRSPTGAAQEFLYIDLNIATQREGKSWRLKVPGCFYREEDLAVFMAVRPSPTASWSIHPLPADVRLRECRMLIRMNAWAILDQAASDQNGTIQLFISGWKPR